MEDIHELGEIKRLKIKQTAENESKQNRNNKSTTLERVTGRERNRVRGPLHAIKLYENFAALRC